jgi:hypothetical protein
MADLANDSEDSQAYARCLSALIRHRRNRESQFSSTNKNFTTELLENGQTTSKMTALPGLEIAERFSRTVVKSLGENELENLIDFLETPVGNALGTLFTPGEISKRIEAFYDAEVAVSKQDRNRLAQPSGPVDSEVGILLHQQTLDNLKTAGRFWDLESRTIQALAKKGFSDQFAYGYDWHWRAENSLYGRGDCSAAKWPTALQELHHAFSIALLNDLRLRFVLIGGSCARKHYKKTPWKVRKTVLLPLIQGLELELDLEFAGNSLRRIVAYVEHPSAVFFTNTAGHLSSCLKLEAGSNFFLWLLGRYYDPISMQTLYWERGFRRPRSAPVAEMRRYSRAERAAQPLVPGGPIDSVRRIFHTLGKELLGRGVLFRDRKTATHRYGLWSKMEEGGTRRSSAGFLQETEILGCREHGALGAYNNSGVSEPPGNPKGWHHWRHFFDRSEH